jgi:hypothetical protein
LITLLVLLVAVSALAVWGWLLRGSSVPARQPSRFLMAPPAAASWAFWGVPSVSPDGRYLAMTSTDSSGQQTLWVRPIDGVGFRRVEGTRQLIDPRPFWSSDSRWVIFAEAGQLKRVNVTGGAPQVICAIPHAESFAGATANSDGDVLLGFTRFPIHRVALSGGTPQPAGALDVGRGEVGQMSPWFLPDGKRYLFVSLSKRFTIAAASVGSVERTELVADADAPAYVPPGLLLLRREGRAVAQLFDAARLRLDGEAEPVEPAWHPETVFASTTGTLIYRAQLGGPVRRYGEITFGNSRLAWFDRAGHEIEALTPLGGYFNPRLSADEQRIVVEQFDNENAGDLWTFDVRRKLGTRFTFDAGRDSDGVVAERRCDCLDAQ